ncbi:MAG: hypothetical protein U5L07_14570 [Desulfobacterales bacterium]|nr:hypothetical protein [Desulfobacterales bacterium]
MYSLPKCIRGPVSSFLIVGFLLIACLGLPSLASAMVLEVGCPQSSSMLVLDTVDEVIHRGDMGVKMKLPISQDPISDMEIILAPGTYNTASGDVTLHLQFRLESIPEEDISYYTGETPIRIEGPGIPWENVHLNVSTGAMEGGAGYWAEFAAAINYSTGYRRLLYKLTLPPEIPVKFYIDRVFKELEMLDILDRPAGPIDHWFQIIETSFGEDCDEGAPLSAYSEYTMNEQPAADIPVTISGVNAIFEPTTATTDAEGIFGVAAFADPEIFLSSNVTSDQVSQESTTKSNEVTAGGELYIEFKETVRKRGLSGAYCEVIRVEGTVRVIGGSGTVQKGDILRPGTKLSLATGWGTISQIGLRFINGSTVEVIQDVYTNACLADIIEIGKTGFVNQSVIQGTTPLASVSRELCEAYGNLPNTPEEWARTAGRVAVQTGASMIVPGSGIAAFSLKYGVKTAAGEAYDCIITSPQSIKQNVQKNVLKLNDTTPDANKLAFVDFYYDGSTRVASNLGDLPVYADTTATDTPLILASTGDWVEIDGTVDRTWQNVDLGQIDGEGPILRLGCEADPAHYTTRFELIAHDTAGVDTASFLAQINGEPSTEFQAKDEQTWQAVLPGTPPTGTISFRLLDKFGNESFLEWSAASMPEAPALVETLPGKWDKGSSYISWETSTEMDSSDLLCYEVRQIWRSADTLSWASGPWISVGRAEEVWLDVPEGVALGTAFYLEIRTVTQNGISGFAARSEELAYAETQPSYFGGPPIGAILNLLLGG